MTTTHVWLLRHAESADPTVFHGAESDIELSEHGHLQAQAAARYFQAFRPTRVISSAMRRAVSTASPIARLCQIPHLLEPGFHERRIGRLCGQSFSSREGPWADTLAAWTSGNTSYTTEGAESYEDLRVRLLAAWKRAILPHQGERIVLVAHGIVCKVLILSLLETWGPSRWHEVGRIENLATCELVSSDLQNWNTLSLLEVPAPVRALRQTTGEGHQLPRSEA